MCGLISSCAPETVSLTLIGLVWVFFSDLAFLLFIHCLRVSGGSRGPQTFFSDASRSCLIGSWSCVLYLPLIRAGPCGFNKNSPVETWWDRCQYFYLFSIDPLNVLIKHLWQIFIMEARYFTVATNFIVYYEWIKHQTSLIIISDNMPILPYICDNIDQ